MWFLRLCEALFDTVVVDFVSLDLKVVCPSKLGETSSTVAERGELGTLQGVPCPGSRLADLLAFSQWGSAIGRAPMAPWHFLSGAQSLAELPWPSPPGGGLRGRFSR